MNEVLNAIISRRSCKQFKPDPVPREIVEQVVQAGLYAPSGGNRQPVKIIAVTEKATRDQLSRMNAEVMGAQLDPFYNAPCVIVVLSDPERRTWVEDGSLVMGNMMNAAQALGLGSCWVHRAKEMFDSEEGKALLAKWGLPQTLRGIGNCILGYPAKEPEAKPRKEGRIVKVD